MRLRDTKRMEDIPSATPSPISERGEEFWKMSDAQIISPWSELILLDGRRGVSGVVPGISSREVLDSATRVEVTRVEVESTDR